MTAGDMAGMFFMVPLYALYLCLVYKACVQLIKSCNE